MKQQNFSNGDEETETNQSLAVMEQEFFRDMFDEHIWPNALEWSTIPFFAALLFIGLMGNFLVIFVVLRNESMRTVTNIFLLNLALADFMVLLFCLPATVLWDVTDTWWFGQTVCQLLFFVQNISVTVSVLTLVCISIERWYAICNPLKFKSTMSRTVRLLLIVWAVAILLAIPESTTLKIAPFNFSQIKPEHLFSAQSVYFTRCTDSWGPQVQLAYQMGQTVALFFIPLLIIGVMYGIVAYNLWLKSVPPSDGNIPNSQSAALVSQHSYHGTGHNRHHSTNNNNFNTNSGSNNNSNNNSINNNANNWNASNGTGNQKWKPCRDLGRNGSNTTISSRGGKEISTRRKAAKMLIAVVILFTICYFPVHLLNILKSFNLVPELSSYLRSLLQFLCRFLTYFNSSVNPIIYNFMCERFQKEFRRACCCLPVKYRQPLGKSSYYESSAYFHRNGGTVSTYSPYRKSELVIREDGPGRVYSVAFSPSFNKQQVPPATSTSMSMSSSKLSSSPTNLDKKNGIDEQDFVSIEV